MNKWMIKMQLAPVDRTIDLYLFRLWHIIDIRFELRKIFEWELISGEPYGNEILKEEERMCYRQSKEQRNKERKEGKFTYSQLYLLKFLAKDLLKTCCEIYWVMTER